MSYDYYDEEIALPGNFLQRNGLLFQINRKVLHPFGFALLTHEDGELNMVITEDPSGMDFGEDTFQDAMKRYDEFLRTKGTGKLQSREEELGWTVQPLTDGPGDTLRDIAETFAETHHADSMTPEVIESLVRSVYNMGYEAAIDDGSAGGYL